MDKFDEIIESLKNDYELRTLVIDWLDEKGYLDDFKDHHLPHTYDDDF